MDYKQMIREITLEGYAASMIEVIGSITYIGYCTAGATVNSSSWCIKKITTETTTVDGVTTETTSIEYANGSSNFDCTWADRNTYYYSLLR